MNANPYNIQKIWVFVRVILKTFCTCPSTLLQLPEVTLSDNNIVLLLISVSKITTSIRWYFGSVNFTCLGRQCLFNMSFFHPVILKSSIPVGMAARSADQGGLEHWRPQKFFQGRAKSTFCLFFLDCWRCNANGRSQNALPFQHHKENDPCYGNSPTNVLRWQQCFFFIRASFHTV